MDRRQFITTGISGSFVLGTTGGLATGSLGTHVLSESRLGKVSYAQQGEDLILDTICEALNLCDPSYLDIGACGPIEGNNTYLLYKNSKGHGVLVEPNPGMCVGLRAKRPRNTVLNVGIGDGTETIADYFMIGGPSGAALNTFSREMAESYSANTNGQNYVAEVIQMPLVSINKTMTEHFGSAPNIVSIDTEGFDLRILKSIDFERFRPAIFCVETLIYGTRKEDREILDFMAAKNYVVRGGTFVNTIFIDAAVIAAADRPSS